VTVQPSLGDRRAAPVGARGRRRNLTAGETRNRPGTWGRGMGLGRTDLQLGRSFKNFILLKHMPFTYDPSHRFSQFFIFLFYKQD